MTKSFRPQRRSRWLAAAGALFLCAAANAEVYKCVDAHGKVSYSGTACPSGSDRQPSGNLSPASAGLAPRTTTGNAEPATAARSSSARVAEKICPSERDISNMETQASSNTLDDKARAFVLDEVRRARSCAREDTHYTREDWQRIQTSIRDQDRSLERDRQAARDNALSVHQAAASAAERERIENEKNREALREAALIQQDQHTTVVVPVKH